MQPSSILSLFRSQNNIFQERELTHLNASWVIPDHVRTVTIYLRKKDSFEKTKGHYDSNQNSWVKTNGLAVMILGWEE